MPLVTNHFGSLSGKLAEFSISDNLSFWAEGYPAVMVCDAAFVRNPNYHFQGLKLFLGAGGQGVRTLPLSPERRCSGLHLEAADRVSVAWILDGTADNVRGAFGHDAAQSMSQSLLRAFRGSE